MKKKKIKKAKGSGTFELNFGECPNCGADGQLLHIYRESYTHKKGQMARRINCTRCHGMFEETYQFLGRKIITQGIDQ